MRHEKERRSLRNCWYFLNRFSSPSIFPLLVPLFVVIKPWTSPSMGKSGQLRRWVGWPVKLGLQVKRELGGGGFENTLTVFMLVCGHQRYPWALLGNYSQYQSNGCNSSPFTRVIFESVQDEGTNQWSDVGVYIGLRPRKIQGHALKAGMGPRALSKEGHASLMKFMVTIIPPNENVLSLSGSLLLCCQVQMLWGWFPALCCLHLFTWRTYLFIPNKMFSRRLQSHQWGSMVVTECLETS